MLQKCYYFIFIALSLSCGSDPKKTAPVALSTPAPPDTIIGQSYYAPDENGACKPAYEDCTGTFVQFIDERFVMYKFATSEKVFQDTYAQTEDKIKFFHSEMDVVVSNQNQLLTLKFINDRKEVETIELKVTEK